MLSLYLLIPLSPLAETKMATCTLFETVKAARLDPERDVYVGLPTEGGKQWSCRVPIRSSNLQNSGRAGAAALPPRVGDGNGQRVQILPGQTHVVQSHQGLRRLLLEFPCSYCPGVKVYQAEREGDRTNVNLARG